MEDVAPYGYCLAQSKSLQKSAWSASHNNELISDLFFSLDAAFSSFSFSSFTAELISIVCKLTSRPWGDSEDAG